MNNTKWNIIMKLNEKDIKNSLINDYKKYDYYPNVYILEKNNGIFMFTGSSTDHKYIRIYKVKAKSINEIAIKLCKTIEETYDFLISNYNDKYNISYDEMILKNIWY